MNVKISKSIIILEEVAQKVESKLYNSEMKHEYDLGGR